MTGLRAYRFSIIREAVSVGRGVTSISKVGEEALLLVGPLVDTETGLGVGSLTDGLGLGSESQEDKGSDEGLHFLRKTKHGFQIEMCECIRDLWCGANSA